MDLDSAYQIWLKIVQTLFALRYFFALCYEMRVFSCATTVNITRTVNTNKKYPTKIYGGKSHLRKETTDVGLL